MLDNLKEKAKKASLSRLRIMLIIAILLLLSIITTVILALVYALNSGFGLYSTAAIHALGLFDSQKRNEEHQEETVEQQEKIVYGAYPLEDELRVKQELIEICNKVGQIYGIPGDYILGILMVETSAYRYPTIMGSGSLYKDLLLVEYKARDGKLFFVDSKYTGMYKDKGGNPITDPLKVGRLRPDADDNNVAKAIGPFQFWSSFIAGQVTRMYVEKDGKPGVVENVPMMSVFDEKLGFLRPNPFYLPDAAVNAAALLVTYMNQHKNRDDIWSGVDSLGLPESIKQDILYIYGTDRYHGDTESRAKGDEAIEFHRTWAKMYGQIFKLYNSKGILKSSLGDFSSSGKGAFDTERIRTLAGGVPFIVGGSIDFDGTFNHSSKVLESDGSGKYVELCDKKYYTPLITEVSNTSPFDINYRSLLVNMRRGPAGSNNKFGWIYGFQGLNQAKYYTALWTNEIAARQQSQQGGSLPEGQQGSEEFDGTFIWPLPSSHTITSRYGFRIHPIEGKWLFHDGIDIGCAEGATVVAAGAGKVIFAGWSGGYGKLIIIDHGKGFETYYAHLKDFLVRVGDTVRQGQPIAKADSTGKSTGNHLHFEIRQYGSTKNPLDYVK